MGKPAGATGAKPRETKVVCEACVPPHTICQHPECGVCRIDCPTWKRLDRARKKAAT